MTDKTQCCMCDIWIDAPFGSVCRDCAKPRQRPPATANIAAGGAAWTGNLWRTSNHRVVADDSPVDLSAETPEADNDPCES